MLQVKTIQVCTSAGVGQHRCGAVQLRDGAGEDSTGKRLYSRGMVQVNSATVGQCRCRALEM